MKIIVGLLIFSVVILFHEFGHFLFARLNHIVVLEFALGMGPTLLKHKSKKSGTVYAWKLLPFGGSCSMLGEDEEDEGKEQEGSFNKAAVWRRISVVLAGPVFNLILGFAASLIVISSIGADPARITQVEAGSAAEAAGLREGDLITRYQGNGIANGREMYIDLVMDGVPTDTVAISYSRDGKSYKAVYSPDTYKKYMLGFSYSETSDGVQITRLDKDGVLRRAGAETGDYLTEINGTEISSMEELQEYLTKNPLSENEVDITLRRGNRTIELDGLQPKEVTNGDLGFSFNMAREKLSFLQTIPYTFGDMEYWLHTTFKSLASLFNGTFTISDMSGPVGIVKTVGDAYEEVQPEGFLITFMTVLNVLCLITVNVGIMNLLPLPALDGGRTLMLLIEAVRRKPSNRELEGRINFAGLMVLMVFMVYVTINDVMKLI